MKRILIIDDSAVVRETVALILGHEFVVLKQPPAASGDLPGQTAGEKIDLFIYGVSPAMAAEVSNLRKFAAGAPYAVLFLLDSKATARALAGRDDVACLVKPFNPYELSEKVRELTARRETLLNLSTDSPRPESAALARYLEYPYLGRTAASLVHRFALSRLPVLITGEVGSGQEQVARAMLGSQAGRGEAILLNAAAITTDYLARKEQELQAGPGPKGTLPALLIENLERVDFSGQSLLLNFLQRKESSAAGWRLVTTTRADLLQEVYRGDFLDGLYYKLATLTLQLPPLRERRDDIPRLAGWFAGYYAKTLGLGEIMFSAAAMERLSNYFWFGNLGELETVIARTLAIHGKARVEAADLVFEVPGRGLTVDAQDFGEIRAPAPQADRASPSSVGPTPPSNGATPAMGAASGHAKAVDLNAMIHELAHELKNPMVTIKTFAQLLGDRYQDANFRARFQDVVGGDIERMDDLLEVMIEFADFSQPHPVAVPLEEKLRTALAEAGAECVKRQTSIRWKSNGHKREVRSDEAQLRYVLKNTLLAVLSQARVGSEVEIDIEKQGCVSISFLREGARPTSIAHYFSASAPNSDEAILPVRVLLAKQLVERNGGRMAMERSDGEREVLKMEFPIA